MSETFKNPTPETLSGENGPWMVTDMNLEKLGLIPKLSPLLTSQLISGLENMKIFISVYMET